MAWTTPLTAVANTALTAAQWNASVRDNLLETAPAKATTGAQGSFIVSIGVNQVAERTIKSDQIVETSEATTSTTYTDLATTGPTDSATASQLLLITITADITNNTAGASGRATFDITGASTIAAADARALRVTVPSVTGPGNVRASVTTAMGVAAGTCTVRTVYRASAGTASFANRRLIIIPY
jgi:hypothetical protein